MRLEAAKTLVPFTVAGLLLVACGAQSQAPDSATPPGAAGGRETTTTQTVPTVEATTSRTVGPAERTTRPTTGTSQPSTPSREATTARVLKPKLTFTDRTVLFERPFRLRLRATTRPAAPVVYRVVDDDPRDSGECRVQGDRLTLDDAPSLSASCVVEARVPPASGVVAPPPVRAVITITPPPVQISVPERIVSWKDAADGAFTIRILENTGDAYGMEVTSSTEQCTLGNVRVVPAPPVRAGTNEYFATVAVKEPQKADYQCDFVATPLPQDIFHDVEGFSFTITVGPKPP